MTNDRWRSWKRVAIVILALATLWGAGRFARRADSPNRATRGDETSLAVPADRDRLPTPAGESAADRATSGSVSGTFVDRAGRAIEGVCVTASQSLCAWSGADGGFSIPCRIGSTLVASARGYLDHRWTARTADAGRVVLQGSGKLRVRTVRSGGETVAGVPVEWAVGRADSERPLLEILGLDRPTRGDGSRWIGSGRTDAVGDRVLTGLPVGRPFSVRALGDGHVAVAHTTLVSGESFRTLPLVLEPSFTVSGTARFQDGPCADEVRFVDLGANPLLRKTHAARVGTEGRFKLALSAGKYATFVVADVYRKPHRGPVVEVPGTVTIDFDLPPVRQVVLDVRDRRGEVIDRASAFLHRWTGEAKSALPVGRFSSDRKDGALSLSYPSTSPPTTAAVVAPGFQPAWVTLDWTGGGQTRRERVELLDGAWIEGTITGAPAAAAVVVRALTGPADRWSPAQAPEVARTTVGEDGRYRAPVLFAGRHEIRVAGMRLGVIDAPASGGVELSGVLNPASLEVAPVPTPVRLVAQQVLPREGGRPPAALGSPRPGVWRGGAVDWDALPAGFHLVGPPNYVRRAVAGNTTADVELVELVRGERKQLAWESARVGPVRFRVSAGLPDLLVAVTGAASARRESVFAMSWRVPDDNGWVRVTVPSRDLVVVVATPSTRFQPPTWGVRVLSATRIGAEALDGHEFQVHPSGALHVQGNRAGLQWCELWPEGLPLDWRDVKGLTPAGEFTALVPGRYVLLGRGIDPTTLDRIAIRRVIVVGAGRTEVVLE